MAALRRLKIKQKAPTGTTSLKIKSTDLGIQHLQSVLNLISFTAKSSTSLYVPQEKEQT